MLEEQQERNEVHKTANPTPLNGSLLEDLRLTGVALKSGL